MSKSQDDLLRKAKRIKERTKSVRQSTKEKQHDTGFHEAQKHISDIHKTYTQVTGTIGWIYNNVIYPVITHPWAGKPFQWYRALWNIVVYVPTNDNDTIFSKQRAGLLVLGTLTFLWMLPAIFNGTVEFVWDTSRMATTYKSKEVWYLGKSQEIDPAGNIFSAQGCESVECSDQTSIYFRIKPSLAHHLWSMYHNGNVFFPDYVAAGIQNDINKCEVTGYGVRWKFLVRNWDVYPQILAVNCTPLTEDDIKGAQGALQK
ncbi:MAG: hypothetical protein ACRBCK_02625 [Alphaproteobacteria bacterium]